MHAILSVKSKPCLDLADKMKIICLIPSLTETLLHCGLSVVGRTRYCVHPPAQVQSIPIVGGTKDVDWDLCQSLGADLVLMDREENTREMADKCPLPYVSTLITSLASCATELRRLSLLLRCPELERLATRTEVVAA